jgi:hypothetical protein
MGTTKEYAGEDPTGQPGAHCPPPCRFTDAILTISSRALFAGCRSGRWSSTGSQGPTIGPHCWEPHHTELEADATGRGRKAPLLGPTIGPHTIQNSRLSCACLIKLCHENVRMSGHMSYH